MGEAIMENLPPLPDGFVLNEPSQGLPPLPDGFMLDEPDTQSEQQVSADTPTTPDNVDEITRLGAEKFYREQGRVPPGFRKSANGGIEEIQKGERREATSSLISGAGDALNTVKNISKVYPAVETGLNLATSAYGVPVSGLGGVATLLGGGSLDQAGNVIDKIQDATVYKPRTESGQQLTESVGYPLEKLDEVGGYVGEKLLDAGYPDAAAIAHTAINAAPTVFGARKTIGKAPKSLMSLNRDVTKAVKKGMKKAVRPSVAGKTANSKVVKYFKSAESAIGEIVKNKGKMDLIDKDGVKVTRLPHTLDEFSQAIEHTKRKVYKEYDSLAKQADASSNIKIDATKTAAELNQVLDDITLQDFSPETIAYAESRMETLGNRGFYTAEVAQNNVQLLNQTLKEYYDKPSIETKGKAFVDAMVANNLREQLNTAITNATGKEYGALKKAYGDLLTIEKEVTHRSLVDARKNNKGLLDFSDVFSGHEIISGMLTKNPIKITTGFGAKSIAKYYKGLNDPNKMVKKMFSDIDKSTTQRNALNPIVTTVTDAVAPIAGGKIADLENEVYSQEPNTQQVTPSATQRARDIFQPQGYQIQTADPNAQATHTYIPGQGIRLK